MKDKISRVGELSPGINLPFQDYSWNKQSIFFVVSPDVCPIRPEILF
jgi:hypothetical protein